MSPLHDNSIVAAKPVRGKCLLQTHKPSTWKQIQTEWQSWDSYCLTSKDDDSL